jgi:ABC-type Fe3+-hydroxamate transport system substrate-binding protein
MRSGNYFLILFISLFFHAAPAFSYPFFFTDHAGNKITITAKPSRVVSLVPSVSEIICKIGAEDTLHGVTWHNSLPRELAKKAVMGGFFSPSPAKIEKIQPDIIFVSRIQQNIIRHLFKLKMIEIYL